MGSIRESSLVNFRALQNETSQDRRGELLKNVTELLGLVSDQCGQNLLDVYDSVMVRLADMVDATVRAEIAAQLAQMRRAPSGIVRKLALDEIEIAQPLLVCSPALNDDDLIGVAEIRGNAHRRAIATRPGLGGPVTRVIVRRANDAVRRVLAGNVTAKLSEECFRRLLDQAPEDNEMQELLAAHPATPSAVLEALAEFATEDIVARIRQRTVAAPEPPQDRQSVASVSKLFAGYDFPTANERMKRRMDRGGVDMEAIGRLLAGDGFAEGAVGFAKLAGFPLREVLYWFALRDIETVTVAARALGAKTEDFERILKAPPWRFRIPAEERGEAIEAFDDLDIVSAKRQLAERQDEQAA